MSVAAKKFLKRKRPTKQVDLRFHLEDDYEPNVVVTSDEKIITDRWTLLRYHKIQQAFYRSTKRFNIVPAGRRSGKTEIAKRRLVKKALSTQWPDARFIAGAPTHMQAKRIFWNDLKRLVPQSFKAGRPSESELCIPLINGAQILVLGLDVPERVEGPPVTHILMDEYGNMKERVWPEHVRPALSDHLGTADFIGAPEGRNHYYDLSLDAKENDDWGYFHWISADILPLEEILAAQRDLDLLTYQQEYEGSFVTFEGLVYYQFSQLIHSVHKFDYQPDQPLIFCFDFNKAPGTAVIVQEFPESFLFSGSKVFTGIFDEVHIPKNSTTDKVCAKLIELYKHHKGRVTCYGDASGGAKGSAKVEGSDWDLVRAALKLVFKDIRFDIPKANLRERVRVNAMNSRLLTMSGDVHMRVDPRCKWTLRDFEGVRILEGSAGEIDKSDLKITHLTDALGYYVSKKFPINPRIMRVTQI